MKQILLNAKECSGRGVRIRLLDLEARSNVLETAAKDIGADGTMAQFRLREGLDGVFSMVVAVTEKAGFKKSDDLVAAGENAGWKKVTFQELSDNSAKYFNAKDMAALVASFRKLHDVNEKEVDDILGEARDVTED